MKLFSQDLNGEAAYQLEFIVYGYDTILTGSKQYRILINFKTWLYLPGFLNY